MQWLALVIAGYYASANITLTNDNITIDLFDMVPSLGDISTNTSLTIEVIVNMYYTDNAHY